MTDNPLSDWTTTKSKVLTELYRKTPQSGYSCDMIIIDEVIDQPLPLRTQEQKTQLQKMLDDYNALYEKQVAEAFKLPESAFKPSSRFSATELQAELNCQMFDEKLAKTWGRNY